MATELKEPVFSLDTTKGFAGWLHDQHASLAISTYQVGKLFMIGVRPDGELWVHNRNIGRCMGLAVSPSTIHVAGETQIFRLENLLGEEENAANGEDALFSPQQSWFTGDLDCHDLAVDADGKLVFVNTLFNCLATVSETHSFRPLWRPPFISRLAAEDRCHLNGLAMVEGQPRFVTAVSTSDSFDGWRDQRRGGGVVIDVQTGDIICRGLSMPHSPRWHAGRLWILNAGSGEFGFIDRGFQPICFCPGYVRGLAFLGNYALIGLSKPRGNRAFTGLPLDAELAKRNMEPRCGVYVVDLNTGDIVHAVTMSGIVSELFDVGVIQGASMPAALGPQSPELKRVISVDYSEYR